MVKKKRRRGVLVEPLGEVQVGTTRVIKNDIEIVAFTHMVATIGDNLLCGATTR